MTNTRVCREQYVKEKMAWQADGSDKDSELLESPRNIKFCWVQTYKLY